MRSGEGSAVSSGRKPSAKEQSRSDRDEGGVSAACREARRNMHVRMMRLAGEGTRYLDGCQVVQGLLHGRLSLVFAVGILGLRFRGGPGIRVRAVAPELPVPQSQLASGSRHGRTSIFSAVTRERVTARELPFTVAIRCRAGYDRHLKPLFETTDSTAQSALETPLLLCCRLTCPGEEFQALAALSPDLSQRGVSSTYCYTVIPESGFEGLVICRATELLPSSPQELRNPSPEQMCRQPSMRSKPLSATAEKKAQYALETPLRNS
ncbi:hypothetical protein CYMTET_40431 [Cymbomonas tetramitiformis]|uniref:Uncharacterized protein n=1 Tax=Cymbomonas tetramitiformis TaxID=36881 RepID=A0AAE0CAB5_9CHLO|nr:hypothetical protein CYMTET_40431 [Cymbomonas tetramitiformis]